MTTSNRFSEALAIQEGACNPNGIARSLVKACDEARHDLKYDGTVADDPAVRLIVHQLAHLCLIHQIDTEFDEYGRLTKLCKEQAEQPAEHIPGDW